MTAILAVMTMTNRMVACPDYGTSNCNNFWHLIYSKYQMLGVYLWQMKRR